LYAAISHSGTLGHHPESNSMNSDACIDEECKSGSHHQSNKKDLA